MFLVCNGSDLIGRLVAGAGAWSSKPPSSLTLMTYTLLRIPLSIPLLFCNIVTPKPWKLPLVFRWGILPLCWANMQYHIWGYVAKRLCPADRMCAETLHIYRLSKGLCLLKSCSFKVHLLQHLKSILMHGRHLLHSWWPIIARSYALALLLSFLKCKTAYTCRWSPWTLYLQYCLQCLIGCSATMQSRMKNQGSTDTDRKHSLLQIGLLACGHRIFAGLQQWPSTKLVLDACSISPPKIRPI